MTLLSFQNNAIDGCGKDLQSHTILQQRICEGATALLCELRKRIFHSLREKSKLKVSRGRQQWLPPFPRFVIQLSQRKRWHSQSEATIFSPSLTWKCGLQSGYGNGIQLCHLLCTCLPMLASCEEEEKHKVTSISLPLPGLGYMLKLLQPWWVHLALVRSLGEFYSDTKVVN